MARCIIPRWRFQSALLWTTTILVFVYLTCCLTYKLELDPRPGVPRMMAEAEAEIILAHHLGEMMAKDQTVCSAIIRGELAGNKDEIAQILRPQERLSEAFYRRATKDCKAYKDKRGFIAAPLSAEERDFPVAYSMAIHGDVEMFERLLRAVYHPQNVYCVHVDQKSAEAFQDAVMAIVSCFPNVFIASKLETVSWGTWSVAQAHLNCMDDLLKSSVEWKYLLNTRGSDLPIKTNAEMVRALKLLNGQNSLESEEMPDGKKVRWQYHHGVITDDNDIDTIARTEIRKTPPPIPVFSGSGHFVVTREFVKHVLENEEAQNFIEWTKDTSTPEEHLWASLNRLSSVPGSVPAHRKYHRSDRTAIARLTHWEGQVPTPYYPPCMSAIRRDMCVYGSGDLRWLFQPQHHHLMASKFDPQVDDIAIRCVEAILRFRALNGFQFDPRLPQN